MSLVIQTKVDVFSKYINEVNGNDGKLHKYFNICTLVNGRPEVIGVPEDVYNKVEQGHSYYLSGGCSNYQGKKNFWFNGLIKEADAK